MQVYVLIGMVIYRYISANNDERISVKRYLTLITMISIVSIYFIFITQHEYDITQSNCFILRKKGIELSTWIKYAMILHYLVICGVMNYFNIKVLLILQAFNVLLKERVQHYLVNPEKINNGELMELNYDGGKASATQIVISSPVPTIHDICRGKTIQGWIRESRKQKNLLMMIIVLEFCSFFTNPLPLLCTLQSIILPAKSVGSQSSSKTSFPGFFYVNQALDPLMLLLTNRSFLKGAKLLLSSCPKQ